MLVFLMCSNNQKFNFLNTFYTNHQTSSNPTDSSASYWPIFILPPISNVFEQIAHSKI